MSRFNEVTVICNIEHVFIPGKCLACERDKVRDLLRRSWFKGAHMEPGLQDEVLAYFEEQQVSE